MPASLITSMHDVFPRLSNAMAVREMRSLMRGDRAPGTLLVCTGLAVAGGLIFLQGQLDGAALLPEEAAQIGRNLFIGIVLLQAVLALLLTPILAAGLLTREYERKAIDDLILTRLTGLEIAWGKLSAAVGYYAVVLLCALPVLSLTFIFGGVSPWEVACSQLLLLATAACMGAVGIHCAARYRQPAMTIIMTVIFVLGWVFLVVPLMVFSLLLSSMMALIAPLVRLQRHSCLLTFCKWTALCVLACLVIALLGFSIHILAFTYPVISMLLILNHRNLVGGDIWFWWLSPLVLSAAMLWSARWLIKQAGGMIRPTWQDLR